MRKDKEISRKVKTFKHAKNPDGTISLVKDETATSFCYTTTELEKLIKSGHLPSELGKIGLKTIKQAVQRIATWQAFARNNPNFSDKDLGEWWKKQPSPNKEEIKKEMQFHKFLLENRDSLLRILLEPERKETFALPSNTIMFSLLAMFAGKPEKIPRKLLAKTNTEWTEEEQKEAEKFITSIINEETIFDFTTGNEEKITKYTAVVCENPKIEAYAEIDQSLFRADPIYREGSLAHYIKRTFGAEGMRHLFALLIGLDENFRQGYFPWSVNEHLERMGYKRKANGSFNPEIKKTAISIIEVFSGLFITARKKEGKKEIIQGERLFSKEAFRDEIIDKQLIDKQIKLRATDFWYKNAFVPKNKNASTYTKLLKKIAKENHREHPITIYLTGLLAIFFRMNLKQKMTVKSLMEWCNLDIRGKYVKRDLRSLESELNYMKKREYLGNWVNNGENMLPSTCKNPLDCCLTLRPPSWLQESIQLIQKKRERLTCKKEKKIITIEEFHQLFKQSGLSNNQLSNHLGISKGYMSKILKGKTPITVDISEKAFMYKEQKFPKSTPLSRQTDPS